MNINDFEIIQNEVLGAHALLEFINYYNQYHEDHSYPELMLCVPVLPIVFHKRSVTLINNRNYKEGSLYRVINECRDINAGLQERMEFMGKKTLKSVNLLLASNLIKYDWETTKLVSNGINFPAHKFSINENYKNIISSSKRLGAWFAQLNYQQITTYFNIEF